MNSRTKILVVDDYQIIREGLGMMLRRTAGVEVVGFAEDGESAPAQARALQPDLVLMDMELGDMSGLDASRHVLAAFPHTRILMLSGLLDPEQVQEGIENGIQGFILKTNAASELVQAIRTVMAGGRYMCKTAGEFANTSIHHLEQTEMVLEAA